MRIGIVLLILAALCLGQESRADEVAPSQPQLDAQAMDIAVAHEVEDAMRFHQVEDEEEADVEDEEEEEEEEEDEEEEDVSEVSLSEVDADKNKDKKKNDKKAKKAGKKKKARKVVPCDITAERGICLFNGAKVLAPDASIPGLIARFTFDDNRGLDSSGRQNHAVKPVLSAPGRGGSGASAFLDGNGKLEIKQSKSLTDLSDFSISFWLYLPEALDPKMPKDCPFLAKGTSDNAKLFSFSFDSKARALTFKTLSGSNGITSRARIGPHRWTHVTAVRSAKSTQLYLHGVLDSEGKSEGGIQEPKSSIFLGAVPWSPKGCRVPIYIDDLRIYNRPLKRSEIEAESFPSLGAVEPSFAHIGCVSCSYGDAVSSCRSGYHLCTQTELNAGGYAVARAMGWGDSQSQVWVAGNSHAQGVRLGVCCGGL